MNNVIGFLLVAAILVFVASRNKKTKPYVAAAVAWIRTKLSSLFGGNKPKE